MIFPFRLRLLDNFRMWVVSSKKARGGNLCHPKIFLGWREASREKQKESRASNLGIIKQVKSNASWPYELSLNGTKDCIAFAAWQYSWQPLPRELSYFQKTFGCNTLRMRLCLTISQMLKHLVLREDLPKIFRWIAWAVTEKISEELKPCCRGCRRSSAEHISCRWWHVAIRWGNANDE